MEGVRAAAARDRDRLAALGSDLLAHHRPFDAVWRLGPGGDAAWRSYLEGLLRREDAAVLVWDAAGELLGFCAAELRPAPPPLRERGRVELTDLFVREAARRRGIARALVAAVLAWARERGGERCEVRVAHANAEGQAFWRALGFSDHVDVLHRRL